MGRDFLGWAVYFGVMAGLAVAIAPDLPGFEAVGVFAVLGAVGLWRYSWAALHLVRAGLYLRLRFPALRRRADALAAAPPEVCVVVTAYGEDAPRLGRVFAALLRAATGCGGPATVVAVLSDRAEQSLIEAVAARLDPGGKVRLVSLVQDGSGKRAALADGLRALARRAPAGDAVVFLMDGDGVVPADGLARCLPFFRLLPGLGALTIDVRPRSDGSVWACDWYAMRFGLRHLLMSSLSLSERLLVVTGRLSAFRAAVATNPAFIAQIEHDTLDHWRHGRIRFLTGDDKSTWFWLLRHGWRMLYVPDVTLTTWEAVPPGGFVRCSVALMRRWYGNMLRSNGRAIALGPRRVGAFTWWCLIDQRLSVWTSLLGPTVTLCWAALVSAWALPAYVLWVLATRLAHAALLGAVRGGLSWRTPLLIYYAQIMGALVKVHVSFRLDRQRWTRQNIGDGGAGSPRRLWDAYLSALATGAFVLLAAVGAGVLSWPDRLAMATLAARAGG